VIVFGLSFEYREFVDRLVSCFEVINNNESGIVVDKYKEVFEVSVANGERPTYIGVNSFEYSGCACI
jgi:hypothetical protein